MRRWTLLSFLVLAACEPGERAPEVGAVQQATVEEGKADGVFGQPDLTTSTLPVAISSNTIHDPVAIGTTKSSSTDSPLIWIPDRGAHRALGLYVPGTTGPSYLAGQSGWTTGERNAGGAAGPTTLNAPHAIAQAFGRVAIADTDNNRVLLGYTGGFPLFPNAVFGQYGSFGTVERNIGGISAETLAAPAGVAFDASFAPGRLMVSDTGNHRVLVFSLDGPVPSTKAASCLGQADCLGLLPNRGAAAPSVNSLSAPRGIATWNNPKDPADPWRGFYVADSGNHRVLHFRVFSAAADFVYGQGDDFTTAIASKGGPSARSLWYPPAVAVDPDGSLWVADTGHHRVLHFPKGLNVADRVLGQPDFTTASPPAAATATTLRAPEGVAVASNFDVWVADTGHHRVLRFIRACNPAFCDDGSPCTDDRCDDRIGCVHDLRTYPNECKPYRCDAALNRCQTACSPSALCLAPYECLGTRCVLRCAGDAACASVGRTCVDGFCCDRPCGGACESCGVPGTEGICRAALAGPPPWNHGCTLERGECGARCDGVETQRCSAAPKGTRCGIEVCVDGVAQVGGSCNGSGTCVSHSRTCAPYACAANGCQDGCFGDHHCAANAQCVGGACVLRADTRASGGCAIGRPDTTYGALGALLALWLLRRRR